MPRRRGTQASRPGDGTLTQAPTSRRTKQPENSANEGRFRMNEPDSQAEEVAETATAVQPEVEEMSPGERSLAAARRNRAPSFQPGQSGNPSGRAPGVVYPVEWMRSMASWSLGAVERARNDPRSPVGKAVAAELILQTMRAEEPRDRRAAISEFADRTTGKPVQEVRVIAEQASKTPQQLIEDLKRRHALAPPEPQRQLDSE